MADPRADAATAATTAGAGAGEHRMSGQDAEMHHAASDDVVGARLQRINQDIGADERAQIENLDRSGAWFSNTKRTYDWHQSMDAQTMLSRQRYQDAETEQRLLHQAKLNSLEIAQRSEDHAQRLRFADANSSIQIALLSEMVDAVANRVWATCPWPAAKA